MTEQTNSKKRQNNKVLMSGASIAGPALAFWLEEYGFDVTVVEKASRVREGGQAVDFKGPPTVPYWSGWAFSKMYGRQGRSIMATDL